MTISSEWLGSPGPGPGSESLDSPQLFAGMWWDLEDCPGPWTSPGLSFTPGSALLSEGPMCMWVDNPGHSSSSVHYPFKLLTLQPRGAPMDNATCLERTALGRGWNGFVTELALIVTELFMKGDPGLKRPCPLDLYIPPLKGRDATRG